jgi:hypothetical protein
MSTTATPAEDSATMNLNGSRTEYRVGFSDSPPGAWVVRKDLDGAKKVARMAAELSPGRKVEILLVTVTPIVITDMTLRSAG